MQSFTIFPSFNINTCDIAPVMQHTCENRLKSLIDADIGDVIGIGQSLLLTGDTSLASVPLPKPVIYLGRDKIEADGLSNVSSGERETAYKMLSIANTHSIDCALTTREKQPHFCVQQIFWFHEFAISLRAKFLASNPALTDPNGGPPFISIYTKSASTLDEAEALSEQMQSALDLIHEINGESDTVSYQMQQYGILVADKDVQRRTECMIGVG